MKKKKKIFFSKILNKKIFSESPLKMLQNDGYKVIEKSYRKSCNHENSSYLVR